MDWDEDGVEMQPVIGMQKPLQQYYTDMEEIYSWRREGKTQYRKGHE